MNWKMLVAAIVAAPFVALLGGVGVLAYNVSQTWDARNTDALISGLVASCGMGGIVVAGLLAAIIGIPMAMRLMDKWRESDALYARGWNRAALSGRSGLPQTPYLQGSPGLAGYQEPQPPLLEIKQTAGSWQSTGVQAYDLWDETVSPEREERYGGQDGYS
jgi:hypothetical protein